MAAESPHRGHRVGDLKDHLILWARGYFCATAGAVDEQTSKRYSEEQKGADDGEGPFRLVTGREAAGKGLPAASSRPRDFQSHPILPSSDGSG